MAINSVAHKSIGDDGTERVQFVGDHLAEVRDLAAEYGSTLGIEHVTGLAGWLHDAGKYSAQFQAYILGGTGKRGSVNHAFAGARILDMFISHDDENAEIMFEMVANAIMSHHNSSGPHDFMRPIVGDMPEFLERMNKEIPECSPESIKFIMDHFFTDFSRLEFQDYVDEAVHELAQIDFESLLPYQSMYERFIASCLVDADHLKTAEFMSGNNFEDFQKALSLNDLNARNEKAVARQVAENRTRDDSSQALLNRQRDQMSQASFESARKQGNLFSLSVPTGGGKTLASLRFGLNRAVQKQLATVIYIVPFTTVIEQNASSVRAKLKLADDDYENVFEYHSAVDEEKATGGDDNGIKDKRFYYARDTWDAPILFTTQVAYLNALFGSGSQNLRHMHRLVNSVLIFDEIQAMPFKCVGMSNMAINWLTSAGRSTGLLCTATQPALGINKLDVKLNSLQEIVPDVEQTEEVFKRVEVVNLLDETWNIPTLIEHCQQELAEVNSVLVVLNTKNAVKSAYQAFADNRVQKFHLSTSMCAVNRKDKFSRIRDAVTAARNGGDKVIVFSTKLIEAGVDLSFESVFRSCAGLDSIVQCAGRCNRNHELPMGKLYAFKMDGSVEKLDMLPDIKLGMTITSEVVRQYPGKDLISAPIIYQYFKSLFERMNSKLNYLQKLRNQPGLGEVSLLKLIYGIGHESDPLPNMQAFKAGFNQDWFDKQDLSAAQQSVAENFQPIDSNTLPVLVQWPENVRSQQLIVALEDDNQNFEQVTQLLKEAQGYVVQVYADQKTMMTRFGDGIIDFLPDYGLYIAKMGAYSDDFGFDVDAEVKVNALVM